MLVDGRFELEEHLSTREIPKNILDIAESHRKRLLWIEKNLYNRMYDEIERGVTVFFDPYRVAADEENVRAIDYMLQRCINDV